MHATCTLIRCVGQVHRDCATAVKMAAISGGLELSEKYKRLAMDYAKVKELYWFYVLRSFSCARDYHLCACIRRLRGS